MAHNQRRAGISATTGEPARYARRLLAVSLIALLDSAGAVAGSPPTFSPAWFAARSTAGTTTNGAAASQPSMAAVQQSLTNLQQAAQSITAMQRLQSQANAAAATTTVPDGLTIGGLQPATGSPAPTWTGANQPTQSTAAGRATVTVQQTAKTATLSWQTFNVGRNTTLHFDQSAGGASANSWVALNRVTDPAAQPSQILGQITAPGQVYILNSNGIIFGPTAQINTAALIASTATLTDQQFADFGIYSALSSGTYTPSFTGAAAPVTVMAGAQITTNAPLTAVQDGGFVMLLGSTVQNAGQITTPAGQTILAAGSDFTLRPGYSVNGVNAATNSPTGNTTSTTLGTEIAVAQGGAVTNTGLIQSTTGDVTLAGAAVTQSGVILATTSVAQRGTIHLLTDNTDPATSVTLSRGSLTYISPDTGTATASDAQRASVISNSAAANQNRGQASLLNDQVALADQQYQSRIEITTGGLVDFKPGSLTVATGGQVAVSAGDPTMPAAPGRILVESGAIIDVAGLVGVSLPASANDLAVNIQGFELRDAPVNRDTTLLNSSNVTVDIRQLTQVPASAAYPTNRYYTAGGLLEVSGELGNVTHTIAEWSTLGGTITLSSPQVVAQPNAQFNLAGGSVQYQAGNVPQSWLVASNGDIYNVNTAPAALIYTGLYKGFTLTYPRWNVSESFTSPLIAPAQIDQAGYTVGRDAGNLVIDAQTTVLEATIDAGVVNGQFQNASRSGVTNAPSLTDPTLDPFLLPQTAVPLGGSLLLGSYNPIGLLGPETTTALIGTGVAPLAASIGATTTIPANRANTTELPASVINDSGLASLSLAASDTITIDSAVTLSPGGQVNLLSGSTQIGGALTSPSGNVTITNIYRAAGTGTSTASLPPPASTSSVTPAIALTASGAILTHGLWTNLLLDPADEHTLAYINGGAVSLDTTGALTLPAGSLIDASSGGVLLASGATKGGAGGNITLIADDPQLGRGALTDPVTLAGTLRSYGVIGGGALTLSAPGVAIAGVAPTGLLADQVALSPGFFQQGFSNYVITGYGGLTDASGNALPGVSVAPGTAIQVTEPVYQTNVQSQSVPTGADPATAFSVVLPSLYLANPKTATLTQRAGASIDLRSRVAIAGGTTAVSGGALDVGAGASVTVDPGQKITLEAYGQVTIDGNLTAPGGVISVLNDVSGSRAVNDSVAYLLDLSIWLGVDSVLNVAGQAGTALDLYGRPYGNLQYLAGGTVVIGNAQFQSNGSVAVDSTSTAADVTSTDAFILIRPGAMINASGAAATIDLNAGQTPKLGTSASASAQRRTVAGSGGAISLSSDNGITIDGTLLAQAGGPTAAGGTLAVALPTPLYSLNTSTQVPIDTPDVLRVPRDLVVGQATAASLLPANLQPGDASFSNLPGVVGQARLSAAQVTAGGFDNLLLFATDAILFDGNVTLRAGQSIQVVSGTIGETQATGQATITAPYVLLRGANALQPSGLDPQNNLTQLFTTFNYAYSTLPPCVSGATTCTSGTLTVQADLIDIQDQVRFGGNLAIPLNPPASGGPAPTLTVDQTGFNAIDLVSSGDIRFLVNATQAASPTAGSTAQSSLASPGDITLTAAQIYPVTGAIGAVAAGFDPTATGTANLYYPNAALTINGIAGDNPAAPLSAFGSISLFAGTINQNGIIRAPEGAIELGGAPTSTQFPDLPQNFQNSPYSNAVNLLAGSITSVSMAGRTIPYGGTADGVTFSYDGLQPATVSTGVVNAAIPGGIVLSAQSITVNAGAVLDLSGGGSLVSAGFVTGRGGSTNTLLTPLLNFSTPAPGATITPASLSTTPVYAVVAGPQPAYAPTTLVDQSGAAGSTPAIGEQITIGAGVPGLPAGTYTLLPSYYALLPGGYRVQFTTGTTTQATTTQATGTTALTNGSFTTPGTIGIANTGIQTTLPTQLTITSGATVRTYSQYDEETYSQFQIAQAALFGTPRTALPIDAKSLELIYPTAPAALAATAPALTVAGTVLTQAASNGYGSAVQVTTDADNGNLEITAAKATPTAGYVSVAAPQLNALGAQTLTIGHTSSGTVVLRDGAVLTGSQVFVSGADITLEPGSGINTLGSPPTPAGLNQGIRNPIYAEIEVSNGQIDLGTPGAAGSISIGTCLPGDTCGTGPVALYSNGTLGFSTLGTLVLGNNVNYGARYITASVADINAGSTDALAAATVPAGLSLSTQLLASLVAGDPAVGAPGLQTLTLTASQSFNLYGGVSLSTINPATGQSSLQQLVLNTPAIYGYTTPADPNATASLTTGTLIWNGLAANGASVQPGPVTANGPGTGTGTLNIAASQIVLGYPSGVPNVNGSLTLDRAVLGFNTVNLTASSAITVGNSGTLSVYQAQSATSTGTLNLTTPLLTGSAGAVASFTAGAAITLQPPASISPSTATQTGLGAAVTLTAGSITDSSAILLPSGSLSMTALTGDVTLAAGSRTDLSGRSTAYFDQTTYSPGGNLTLESTAGNITQAATALIDVSALNNNAGGVTAIAMAGTVALNGPINGAATTGYAAGDINIRALALPDFTGLNQRLNTGGVFGARNFDIGTGDLTIGNDPATGGVLLKAHTVSVSLDDGSLTVTGTIDASGAAPGSVALSAGGNLTVAGTAVLDAHGTTAQTDSLGQTIDASNTASVTLTVASNVGGGINNNQDSLLTLAPGATIDVSAAPGVTCALGACGQLTLNAPRITDNGAASPNDVAISAAGPLTIKGAGSVAVNAFYTYQPTDPNGTILQDNGGTTPLSATGLIGLNQIDTQDSQPFINAALVNPTLAARLAGLPAGYHLRPGVEIDSSSASGGNLTVAGDLDLSAYRYGPNAATDPASPSYGAGEPGVLVLRAADNLSVGGSITDGFAPPPPTPDDQGWVIASATTTAAPIVYLGPPNQTLTVGANAVANGGTTFPNNNSLGYAVTVAADAVLAKDTLLPVPVTLGRALRVNQRFTTTATVRIGTHTYTAGQAIPAFTTIPANTVLPAGFTIPSVTTSVPFSTAAALTWPANTSLTDFTTATITLATGDVIPAGTTLVTAQPFAYRTGHIWAVAPLLPAGDLSWSIELVAGADLAAADSRTLRSASALAATATLTDPTPGSITLNDPHYQDPADTTVNTQALPSVIRTGTGSLEILAGGNFAVQSLYGVYTAGTQSPGITAADNQPRADYPGATSVLGTLGDQISLNGATYNTAVADYQAYYPQGGGNLTLSAQGTVSAYAAAGGTNSAGLPDSNAVGNWLWWQGGNGTPAAWWINYGTYVPIGGGGTAGASSTIGFIGFTGIGALGGGNVAVSAGGGAGALTATGGASTPAGQVITSALDIAVASTGRTDIATGTETLTGGGTLSLTVGGMLNPNGSASAANLNGTLTNMRGSLSVQAAAIGSLTPNPGVNANGDPRFNDGLTAETASWSGGPILVLGDATATLTTRGDLVLGGAGDPTRETQTSLGSAVTSITSGTGQVTQTWFSLWQPNTAITLFSAGGNVVPVSQNAVSGSNGGNATSPDGRTVYPPILNVAAASGSIYLAAANSGGGTQVGSLELAPSAQGQARFLAAQSIYDQSTEDSNVSPVVYIPGSIDISGANPALLPTPFSPAYSTLTNTGAGNPNTTVTNTDPTAHQNPGSLFALAPDTPTTGLHANDPTAALFYAAAGDIVGLSTGEEVAFGGTTWYIAAKSVRIVAGRDIVGLGIPSGAGNPLPTPDNGSATGSLILNARTTDVSEIIAGRDIIDANAMIAGPGTLYVQAGRNLYQPTVQPTGGPAQNFVLESIGPQIDVNAASRDGGADITVLAGAGATGPDWSSFASLYLNPANLANATTPLQDQPGRVERTYQTQLLTFLQQRFNYTGGASGALAYFDALPIQQQRIFLLQVYFDELNQSGLDFNNPSSRFYKSYLEGNDAIATLLPAASFPTGTDTGDVTLEGGSGIRTDFGGNLTLLVPGGATTLGTTGSVAPPSTTGLLTQGSGAIDIYSHGSVLLGQSRVFTTFGGNILIWSASGDINAGRGAKSTVLFAPEQIAYDLFGDILLSPTVPSTGAGIATLAPIAQVPPGDINLIAPLGVIDAGEAGIRSSGNANLAALQVLNAANIQVQGKATGIPVIAVPNVAAATAAAAAAGAAQQAAQSVAATPRQSLIPSIFVVEVVGFGGGQATQSQ